MRKNIILGLAGITLFFLVITVLYAVISFTNDNSPLQAFMPLIVFSGFFIFLIGAILVALYIYNVLEKR